MRELPERMMRFWIRMAWTSGEMSQLADENPGKIEESITGAIQAMGCTVTDFYWLLKDSLLLGRVEESVLVIFETDGRWEENVVSGGWIITSPGEVAVEARNAVNALEGLIAVDVGQLWRTSQVGSRGLDANDRGGGPKS